MTGGNTRHQRLLEGVNFVGMFILPCSSEEALVQVVCPFLGLESGWGSYQMVVVVGHQTVVAYHEEVWDHP